jgi:para-aminobenzoate synthetase component 1
VEGEKRGFYTGVFGYFDGQDLDSGVMIRFIERRGDKYFYRSGGGITTQSVVESEYQEAIDKVYVPVA